jgi:hypothetical protein
MPHLTETLCASVMIADAIVERDHNRVGRCEQQHSAQRILRMQGVGAVPSYVRLRVVAHYFGFGGIGNWA